MLVKLGKDDSGVVVHSMMNLSCMAYAVVVITLDPNRKRRSQIWPGGGGGDFLISRVHRPISLLNMPWLAITVATNIIKNTCFPLWTHELSSPAGFEA